MRVVGYATSWSGTADAIQYSKLTHINYAFLLPNSDGSIQAIDNPAKLQAIVGSGHANGVKVLISVGGWMNGDPSPFVNLSGNGTARANFVNNLVNFVNQYGLDGVDIDWEAPTSATAGSFNNLMNDLANAMHSRGKLLTAAVTAFGGGADPIPSSVFGMVDFLNAMDYDNNNYDHSTYASAVTTLDYWSGRGLSLSKVSLGVPFYSHPGLYTFAQLLSMGASPNSDTWNGQGYNGIPTIQSKTNLCFDRGAGGIMMWELSQDATGANSLLSAIDQVVKQRGPQIALAVYYLQNVGNTGIALQGTGDPYLNGSGQYVGGCNEVAVTPYNKNAQQQWSILPLGNGQYNIDNTSSHQWLQATGDPYHPHGGGNVAGCDKVAITPASGSNSQQVWLIAQTQPGGGWTIGSPANSQYLHATGDTYWSNLNQSYVSGCYQTAGVPYSWGVSTVREWYITWYRN